MSKSDDGGATQIEITFNLQIEGEENSGVKFCNSSTYTNPSDNLMGGHYWGPALNTFIEHSYPTYPAESDSRADSHLRGFEAVLSKPSE
ncbi:hypothetical protein ACFQE1_02165 [Halobium palmae]|uniref:Uncharacterized protein n=1 Tax=Halobium palmae TaxID=1776492 RepID=A0ABD5RV29_9EURY